MWSPEERHIKYIGIHTVYLSSMTLWDIPRKCTSFVTRYYNSHRCCSIHKQFICVIVKNINILSSIATQYKLSICVQNSAFSVQHLAFSIKHEAWSKLLIVQDWIIEVVQGRMITSTRYYQRLNQHLLTPLSIRRFFGNSGKISHVI